MYPFLPELRLILKFRAIIFLACYLVLLVQPVMPMVQYQLNGGCISDFFLENYAVLVPCLCELNAKQTSERDITQHKLSSRTVSAGQNSGIHHADKFGALPFLVINQHQISEQPAGQQPENIPVQDLLNLDNHAVFTPMVFNPKLVRVESENLLTGILECHCIQVPYSPPCAPPQFPA